MKYVCHFSFAIIKKQNQEQEDFYMNQMLRNKKIILWFLLPSIIIFTATVIFPIIWSGYYSFFNWNGIGRKTFAGLSNFSALLKDRHFISALSNNLIYLLINLVGQLGVALLLALLLSHLTWGKSFFKTLYFAPAILSGVAVCQAFKCFYALDPPGLFNLILQALSLEHLQTAWLGNMETALGSVAIIECYKNMGIYLIIIYAGLLSIPTDVLESAQMDGAKGWIMFWKIKMPYLKNVLGAALIMAVNGLLKAFDIPYITTYGGPGNATELVATYMYKTAFSSAKYGYGSAIAVVIAIECILLVSVLQSILNRNHD